MKAHTKALLKLFSGLSIIVFTLFTFMTGTFSWFLINTTATLKAGKFQAALPTPWVTRLDIYQQAVKPQPTNQARPNTFNTPIKRANGQVEDYYQYQYDPEPALTYTFYSANDIAVSYNKLFFRVDNQKMITLDRKIPSTGINEDVDMTGWTGMWLLNKADALELKENKETGTITGSLKYAINSNGNYIDLKGTESDFTYTPKTKGSLTLHIPNAGATMGHADTAHIYTLSLGLDMGSYDAIETNRSLLYVFTTNKDMRDENVTRKILFNTTTKEEDCLLATVVDKDGHQKSKNVLHPESATDFAPNTNQSVILHYGALDGAVPTNTTGNINVETQARNANFQNYITDYDSSMKINGYTQSLELFKQEKQENDSDWKTLPENIGVVVEYDGDMIALISTLYLGSYATEQEKIYYDCDWSVEIL